MLELGLQFESSAVFLLSFFFPSFFLFPFFFLSEGTGCSCDGRHRANPNSTPLASPEEQETPGRGTSWPVCKTQAGTTAAARRKPRGTSWGEGLVAAPAAAGPVGPPRGGEGGGRPGNGGGKKIERSG